jgi:hypothetical protein
VNAALYLASDESTFITGVSLSIDGGLTHNKVFLSEAYLYKVGFLKGYFKRVIF